MSRLPTTSSASLEVNTDEMFAEANDLQQPMTALTSTKQLILPIANDSDEEIIVKKNKRIGTINIIQAPANIQELSPGGQVTSSADAEQTAPSANAANKQDLKETVLDQADTEHFGRTLKERRNFILSALKLQSNKLLDTQEKIERVVKLMLKHWRILDSTDGSMRIGRVSGIKHKILLKPDAILSHEKPRPLNPILRKEVETQLQKLEKQNIIQRSNGFPRHTSPLVAAMKKWGSTTVHRF